jgi:probable HAF family extracellular repeat protein
MKFTRLMSLKVLALLVSILLVPHWLAAQDERHRGNPTHYTVQNLGSLGGTGCCFVITINDRGWVDGTSNLAGDHNFHPFLWRDGKMQDLGTLGGPYASVGGMNDVGDVTVGGADTTTPDPLGEDWCGFGTYLICRSYVWRNGRRTLVPTLGGNNGDVSGITNAGLVFGFAETAIHDPTCIAPEVLGFEAFVWDPDQNEIRVLPPLPGDTVSAGAINEHGEGAGASGICGHGVALTSALHAVVWKNGVPSDIGSLGGSFGNLANFINNEGQVVGQSDLTGDTTFHGFLWTEDEGLKDLGTLPGDVFSIANSINDDGQIAMQSCDANFNCRAAIWQNGVMSDLNTLIPADSPLFLLFANSINSRGQIAGTALDQSTGNIVPFLATPIENASTSGGPASAAQVVANFTPKVTLPANVCDQLRKHLLFSRFKAGLTTPQ